MQIFSGDWYNGASDSAENVVSKTGYVIIYAECPVSWTSKLQSNIFLSTAEAKYIALSSAMRKEILSMYLLK